jgi:elongation factor Ts
VTEIPAALVKELRERTGAGMMDCKRALVDAGGDLDEATKVLREKGLAAASKREGRETKEGKVLTAVHGDHAAIAAVGCETEPVSNNEEFIAYAERVLDTVDADGPDAVERLDDERIQLVAKLGENIEVRGAARMETEDGEVIAEYVHPPARKIGVLVRMAGDADLARMVAMHIASARPEYLTRDAVSEEEIQQEREIYEKLPDVESKPEDIRAKIVEGMIQKRFFSETVLLDQAWIYDPNLTVGKALAERGAEVKEFVVYALGQ